MGGGKYEKLGVGKMGSRGSGEVGKARRWLGRWGGVGCEVGVGWRWKLGVWWFRGGGKLRRLGVGQVGGGGRGEVGEVWS